LEQAVVLTPQVYFGHDLPEVQDGHSPDRWLDQECVYSRQVQGSYSSFAHPAM
jgi:hypothetical protein